MNSANKVSGLNPPNRYDQQYSNSLIKEEPVPLYGRQLAMKNLAEMSMPVETQIIIANVDTVIADAMQTITDSLERTSHYIDTAKKQLMLDHPELKQAYAPNNTSEGTPSTNKTPDHGRDTSEKAPAHTLTQNKVNELQSDTNEYQSKVLSAHENQQKQAMAKQEAISKAAADMQQQLMAQQHAYQQHILSAALNTSAPMASETEKEKGQDQHGSNTNQHHKEDSSVATEDSPTSLAGAHKEE